MEFLLAAGIALPIGMGMEAVKKALKEKLK